ncbi:MAG: hypothetical protein WCX61_05085 [Candidatus Peribacteraceae bacterium]|jgi:molecular chaperone GrpE (heat shock protein)
MTKPLIKNNPQPPRIPSGQEIYDGLMGKIEPELLTANLPMLEEQSAHDTPEQKEERMQRYQKAFEEYDRQYQEYIQELTAAVENYKRTALKSMENQDRTEEANTLSNLENSISTS